MSMALSTAAASYRPTPPPVTQQPSLKTLSNAASLPQPPTDQFQAGNRAFKGHTLSNYQPPISSRTVQFGKTLRYPKADRCPKPSHSARSVTDTRILRIWDPRLRNTEGRRTGGWTTKQVTRRIPVDRVRLDDIIGERMSGEFVAVVDRRGHLRLAEDRNHRIRTTCGRPPNSHAHVGQDEPALFAGTLTFRRGKLKRISAQTGTYRTPGPDTTAGKEIMAQILDVLREQGLSSRQLKEANYRFYARRGGQQEHSVAWHYPRYPGQTHEIAL